MKALSGSAWPMNRTHRPPTIPVTNPEITNAVSFTRMALTPRPRARSSSSLMASSCRPNRDPRISQDKTIAATAIRNAA